MTITSFQGTNRWLSNFYPAKVTLDGVEYPTVEHAYQAAKTLDLNDRNLFRGGNPGLAKRLGRDLELRSDWDTVKIGIMRDLLRQKFAGGELHFLLLQTKGIDLVEGNNWGDRFWGVCAGVGENWLGRLLMEIRDETGGEVAG
jgi:ribA/ribD-fused uncharacterized protein